MSAFADQPTMIFAYGFGCDQNMCRFVEPALANEFKTVLFDHVGAGAIDLTAYDRSKYASLAGYADDVVEIGRELGLKDAVFVGHSVSGMIGALAAQQAPEKVAVSTFGRNFRCSGRKRTIAERTSGGH